MKYNRIKARLAALKEIFALPPPVRLLMSDGRVEEIPVSDEDHLAFIERLFDRPGSREVRLICDSVAILQQPGRLLELVQAVMEDRQETDPEPGELGLGNVEHNCGQPPSKDDREAR
jgi:hypothetical protein